MSQYTIIYKYGKRRRQLKIRELKNFQERMAAGENRFAPELNEKEPIELCEDLSLSNVLVAFLIKQLFCSRLLDMR